MAVVVVGVGALLLVARPAAAHTELESSSPGDGTTVEQLDRIDLDFTEDIEVALSHVWLQDAAGIIELAPATAIDGRPDRISVPVPPVGDGRYTVTWHVVAADATPVQGTFTFTLAVPAAGAGVGPVVVDPSVTVPPPDVSGAIAVDELGRPLAESPPATTPTIATIPAIPEHGHGAGGATRTLARGLLDASLSTLIGGLAFVAAVWPQGARLARTRLVLWSAAILATLASFELAAFQHADATGLSTLAALSPWHQWDALQFRFGQVAAARIVLLLVAAVLTARLARGGERQARSIPWCAAAAGLALGLVETLVLLGHTSDPGPVATAARLAHVLGVSVWLGGLVMLCCVVLPRRRADELLAVLPRFSALATVSVGVLTVGGAVLAVDLVGAAGALPSTDYGRALLAKVALVALLLFVASLSRGWVRSDLSSSVSVARPLAIWIGTEVGLMAAVFGLTAVLVTQLPPG